jgi:hypothetical protein
MENEKVLYWQWFFPVSRFSFLLSRMFAELSTTPYSFGYLGMSHGAAHRWKVRATVPGLLREKGYGKPLIFISIS